MISAGDQCPKAARPSPAPSRLARRLRLQSDLPQCDARGEQRGRRRLSARAAAGSGGETGAAGGSSDITPATFADAIREAPAQAIAAARAIPATVSDVVRRAGATGAALLVAQTPGVPEYVRRDHAEVRGPAREPRPAAWDRNAALNSPPAAVPPPGCEGQGRADLCPGVLGWGHGAPTPKGGCPRPPHASDAPPLCPRAPHTGAGARPAPDPRASAPPPRRSAAQVAAGRVVLRGWVHPGRPGPVQGPGPSPGGPRGPGRQASRLPPPPPPRVLSQRPPSCAPAAPGCGGGGTRPWRTSARSSPSSSSWRTRSRSRRSSWGRCSSGCPSAGGSPRRRGGPAPRAWAAIAGPSVLVVALRRLSGSGCPLLSPVSLTWPSLCWLLPLRTVWRDAPGGRAAPARDKGKGWRGPCRRRTTTTAQKITQQPTEEVLVVVAAVLGSWPLRCCCRRRRRCAGPASLLSWSTRTTTTKMILITRRGAALWCPHHQLARKTDMTSAVVVTARRLFSSLVRPRASRLPPTIISPFQKYLLVYPLTRPVFLDAERSNRNLFY